MRRYEPARPQPSPAVMQEAAIAADAREAFPGFHDEEEADRTTPVLYGAVELALAQD